MITWIVLGVVLVGIYMWYAGIIKKKNKVLEALGGIDAQLKKRHNLIPNLLKMAQKFMEHERGLLEEIAKLRESAQANENPENAAEAKELFGIEGLLQGKMGQFFARMEAYPDLKSDQTMQQAMISFNNVEEDIAASRRFYNAAVGELNNSVQIFPGNMIAKLANAETMPFYEAEEEAKAPVDAGEFLK